jgi:LPS sulfotransferase NodH
LTENNRSTRPQAATFLSLNLKRRERFRKDPDLENVLLQMNRALEPVEEASYKDRELAYPLVFVFGLPRSGTTVLTQLLSQCLDLGFINNLTARFWLAPVTGVRISRTLVEETSESSFESKFGATNRISDIHEFGYFWRHWLKKESLEDIETAKDREDSIDWIGLRRVLANLQHEFGKAMVFKNIFGSYHLSKLQETLGKVVFVYIERDPLDVAVSILRAREEFYIDPNQWWSYAPPEYRKLLDLDYRRQIAGQIHYLKKFYSQELENLEPRANLVRMDYETLMTDPGYQIEKVRERAKALYGYEIGWRADPPRNLSVRRHADQTEERERFRELLANFADTDG